MIRRLVTRAMLVNVALIGCTVALELIFVRPAAASIFGSGLNSFDIEFVTIVRGDDVLDGPNVGKEAIINDLDAYTVFFEGSPPNTPDVNWEEEMVVAVALGA